MVCELFESITEEEQKKMLTCASAKEKTFAAGDYIFRQGDPPKNMYLVIKGSVMVAKDFFSGKRNVLFMVYEKDVIGEMFAFSDESQYWYDAIASEPTTVLEIPFGFFFGFCENACRKHQTVVKNMLCIFSRKSFMMTKKLYLLSGKTLKERISMWVLDNAGEKDTFKSDMNREELSDYLGTTRPSLSRELMAMQDEGLIEVERSSFKIKDREGLEYYAE